MSLVIDANEGLLLLAAEPYDETVVHWIRTVPQRRYRRQSHDWCIPARREHLLTVCSVIAELEERGIAVKISDAAAARLARVDTGRATLRGGAVEIAGPYSERRLPALRALPERRFDVERKLWTVPLTRAGALAILALADNTDELVMTQRARRTLQRAATASLPTKRNARDADARVEPTTRRSPVAHWRHYTARRRIRQPRPAAHQRPRHRVVRTHPSQSGPWARRHARAAAVNELQTSSVVDYRGSPRVASRGRAEARVVPSRGARRSAEIARWLSRKITAESGVKHATHERVQPSVPARPRGLAVANVGRNEDDLDDRVLVTLTKPCDGGVIGHLVGRDHPKRDVLHTGPLDPP